MRSFFKEPRQDTSDTVGTVLCYLGMLLGLFSIVWGLYEGTFVGGLLRVGFGVLIFLMAVADLLSGNRTTLAGWLRLGAILQMTLILLALLVATILHNL